MLPTLCGHPTFFGTRSPSGVNTPEDLAVPAYGEPHVSHVRIEQRLDPPELVEHEVVALPREDRDEVDLKLFAIVRVDDRVVG